MAKPSSHMDRFNWAAKIVNPNSDDHILEIGVGAGLFLAELATKADSGFITGVDISQSMIDLATKRNQKQVAAGKIRLRCVDFLNPQTEESLFDKVVSFNLNIFWKFPELAFPRTRRILKPDGQLFIFYQSPNHLDISLKDKLVNACIENHFSVEEVVLGKFSKPAFGIIAKDRSKKK